ncbi:MAG: protein tyrosine phosphatase [Cytophagales bacterium CG12_big_fil_rev_8_21_14_0_65_40_12]|nr:MAG: protein tyrosine phosphatase [Cytophagales bacterium CG12_big_fil_rev_8_21_14_0_65_40_12]PIW03243.1 MAG: protein tyrosine phosphatase [Cytophagales bacterium CG17_big_fil_post_rev_8_21_14_2_50_40_13]
MSKVKVLFVCLGNICRSPLAEGIFTQKVIEMGLSDHFEIDSCGTSNYHIGEQPDPRTIKNALKNGVELNHQGRQFTYADFLEFDYILPMDQSNKRDIERLRPGHERAEALMMRYFDPLDKNANVPDPYYDEEKGFQEVFEILYRSCASLLDFLVKKHLN